MSMLKKMTDRIDLARRAVAVVPLEKWPTDTPISAPDAVYPTLWCAYGYLRDGEVLKVGTYVYESVASVAAQRGEVLPCLRGPCGQGALLGVLEERLTGNSTWTVLHTGGEWGVWTGNGTGATRIAMHADRVEALVLALEVTA